MWLGYRQSWALVICSFISADALRPAGIMPDPPVADVLVALDTYKKWGRRVVHAVPDRGVSLAATDADWRRGSGTRRLEERPSISCCWSPTGDRSSTASMVLA